MKTISFGSAFKRLARENNVALFHDGVGGKDTETPVGAADIVWIATFFLDFVDGGKEVGKVQGETRKIKFRDDNYAIDSGSRFADIVPEINLDADEFIKALTDAIMAEQKKSGISLTEAKKEQKKREKAEAEQIKKNKDSVAKLDEYKKEIISAIKDNKDNIPAVKAIMGEVKTLGYDNPTQITKLEDAEQVLAVVKANV